SCKAPRAKLPHYFLHQKSRVFQRPDCAASLVSCPWNGMGRNFADYLARSIAADASVAPGECESLRLALPGRSRVTEHGGAGGGFHPAMVRAQARTFALSVIPGNRRRSSMAADNSPS